MRFNAFPKTGGEWDHTALRSVLVAGCMLLVVQAWARLALSGNLQQHIEERLWPLPFFLGFLLLFCSVAAAIRRQRLLSLTAAVVATLSVIIALLPMLFVSGMMGPYMAPIPANASAGMLFSFFVAMVVAPTSAA